MRSFGFFDSFAVCTPMNNKCVNILLVLFLKTGLLVGEWLPHSLNCNLAECFPNSPATKTYRDRLTGSVIMKVFPDPTKENPNPDPEWNKMLLSLPETGNLLQFAEPDAPTLKEIIDLQGTTTTTNL